MTARPPLPLDDLLRRTVELGASDLHLTASALPRVRVDGELRPLPGGTPLGPDGPADLLRPALSANQQEALAKDGAVDLALVLPAPQPPSPRFRINAFSSHGRVAVAIRRLDDRIRTLEELRLPAQLARIATLEDGLVLLVGPTGSGKTTTLATIVDHVNASQDLHVVTLEDPIEYVHESRRCLVHQRELHADFRRFSHGVRAALREDPDVILVGELRDVPTMRAALMAAETGHLVLSTLHSGGVVGAPERFVGAFHGDEKDAIRHQLSMVLKCVVAQRLLPLAAGRGRFPACEVLWVTPAIQNLIRTARAAQIQSAVEGQAGLGMVTLEQSLAEAVLQGWIKEDAARAAARDPQALTDRIAAVRSRAGTGRVGSAIRGGAP